MSEYTAETSGLGCLRLLNAIRSCGLEKKCRLYQAMTLFFVFSISIRYVLLSCWYWCDLRLPHLSYTGTHRRSLNRRQHLSVRVPLMQLQSCLPFGQWWFINATFRIQNVLVVVLIVFQKSGGKLMVLLYALLVIRSTIVKHMECF